MAAQLAREPLDALDALVLRAELLVEHDLLQLLERRRSSGIFRSVS